jgi:hypothetical protein
LLIKTTNIKIYGGVILPIILYGCGTWSLALGAKLKMRVLENKVLSKVFGPKRDEVTGEWSILHNEELNDLYVIWVNRSRILRWTVHVVRVGGEKR